MTGPRRSAATALSMPAPATPLACVVAFSINNQQRTPPSAPPAVQPPRKPAPNRSCPFDPETAATESLGASLQAWAQWLLDDPDVHGAASFARAFQDSEGALQPDQRLVPLRLFVGGGSYDVDNRTVKDAAAAMRIRGPIAQQLHDLPEGTVVRLSTS